MVDHLAIVYHLIATVESWLLRHMSTILYKHRNAVWQILLYKIKKCDKKFGVLFI